MIEFVFKPSRRVDGKRVVERLYSGRYAVGKGEKPVTVRLNTPDKLVASKRLRDIVVEQQQEREGIILPKSIRQAAATNLGELLNDYATDLEGLGRARKHVHDIRTPPTHNLDEHGIGLVAVVDAPCCNALSLHFEGYSLIALTSGGNAAVGNSFHSVESV